MALYKGGGVTQERPRRCHVGFAFAHTLPYTPLKGGYRKKSQLSSQLVQKAQKTLKWNKNPKCNKNAKFGPKSPLRLQK
jgi:hypothetical protein